ncbi:MAG: asparagine synthase (glutamine-hydrolyzing) [Nanoarchaeota archaeon]
MCGIAGFNWADRDLIKKMTSLIAHRGPDDSGFYIDKDISLGHRRLSILDLSLKGHQPMYNENRDVLVVFNGEIYNYPILKNELIKEKHKFFSESDTEVIIHGYEQWGENLCVRLEGMFAFALYDKRKKRLLIARDRIGKKPLYYFWDKKRLIFASEIKAILLDEEVKRDIDYQCLSDYLTMRFSIGEKTMFKHIKKLEPGHFMVYDGKNIKIESYWSLPSFEPKIQPKEQEVDKLIESSIKKRLMADVPIGVFLSGGLDSSTIVAYMSRIGAKIKTFSIGFNHPTDETLYARIISNKFKTEHTEIKVEEEILQNLPRVVWHFDEPLADPAALPIFVLSREVAKKVKVALSGEGGDEVFGGYDTFNSLNLLYKINKLPGIIKQVGSLFFFTASKFFKYPKKQFLKLGSEILKEKDVIKAYEKLFYFSFSKDEKNQLFSEKIKNKIDLSHPIYKYLKDERNLHNQTLNYYFKEWLPNDLLMKADKMSMANSLEIRNPFLDCNLIEYFAKIDNSYKQKRWLFRKVITKLLPDKILKKKKQGFTLPISEWFTKKEFFDRMKEHFDSLAKRDIFNPSELRKIIENPSAFRNDHKLWVLLNFEIWCKIYLDKIPYDKIIL